jgi:uncharacterized membrane protein YdbT with pleckstrin-like domain
MADDPDRGGGASGPPPAWLPLAADETVQWRGGPRIQTAAPFVLVGLLAVLAGAGLFWVWSMAAGTVQPVVPALAALAVTSGIAVAVWAVLHVETTAYVVTDRHLSRKRGILSRRVTTVGYDTVQNVSYSQGLTGRLFDHGTVEFDTAGGSGTELAFDDVDDPRAVQRLVGAQRQRFERDHGVGGAADDGGTALPGRPEQWAAVREEVVALRRAVENRQR